MACKFLDIITDVSWRALKLNTDVSSQDMRTVINQAFLHVDALRYRVQQEKYDLIDAGEVVISRENYDHYVQPGCSVRMRLWPLDQTRAPSAGRERAQTERVTTPTHVFTEVPPSLGRTPLHEAVLKGNLALVGLLLR